MLFVERERAELFTDSFADRRSFVRFIETVRFDKTIQAGDEDERVESNQRYERRVSCVLVERNDRELD